MIQIQKKLIKVLILLLISCSLQADKVDVTLRQFANIVAEQNKINILISQDIEDDSIVFYLADKTKAYVMLPAFQKMLHLKQLQLIKNQGFYSIEKIIKKEPDINYHSIKLDNLVYDDVKNILEINDIKSTYIASTNSVGFKSTFKTYNILKNYINALDVKLPQMKFKINIFYTNIDNLKDRGFNLSAYTQSVKSENQETSTENLTYFLNLITMPYTATSNVVSDTKNGFYATVKYLNQNGFTDIKNSPVLTAISNKKVSFSSVKTIPYLTTATSTSDTTTTSSNSYDYKDVGLQIGLTPYMIGDTINFDLTLIVEELLSTSSLTPTTDKKELNGSYRLKKGEILVLSGVNKESSLTTEYNIPLLSKIYLLGELFQYKSHTKTKDTLTISIEVL